MAKPTKSQQIKEDTFSKEIAPLMDAITDLCEKHNFPFIVAVQLYTSKKDGARIAAQSVENGKSVLQLKLSSKLLRGEAEVTADGDSFYITLADEVTEEKVETRPTIETLQEHAAHCSDCRELMEERISAGEDISNIRIMADHDEPDGFQIDETMLPKMGAFFSKKASLVH